MSDQTADGERSSEFVTSQPGARATGPARPIVRARLSDRLLLSPPARLVVLCAPAGYSKTTTLRSWSDADRRPFCWITCDRRHDDPAHLIVEIARALDTVAQIDEQTIEALAREAAWPDKALDRLRRAVTTAGPEFVLAIDDAHRLGDERAVALLEGLPMVLPAEAQIAISSRSTPPIHLGRMRANRDLLELGIRDLAMTHRESQRLLESTGLRIDGDLLDKIHERTEGWPAALHLASLALRESQDLAGAVEAFAGDDRAVAEYLRDEFLSVTDPGLIDFMVRTSILETLSGPCCDAVLERGDSAAILQELSRSNPLVIPLDRKDEHFRYHHLFSDMLRSELARREPAQIDGLHARASRWFASHGQPEPAVEHAISSGDACLAGRLIWDSVPDLTARGRLATLNRWLNAVGQDRFTECHGLLFAAAHTSMLAGAGDRAEFWLSLAEDIEPAEGCPVEVEIDLPMLRATQPRNGTAAMGSDAQEVLDRVAPDSVWRGAANLYLGVSRHLLGDPGSAAPVLRESARLTAMKSPVIQALALAQLAVIALEGGEPDSALREVSVARSRIDRCGLAEFPAMTLVYAIESMVLANLGRSGRALESLATGRHLVEMLNSFPPWYEAEARLAMSQACLTLEMRDAAGELLAQARRHLDLAPGAAVLHDWQVRLGEQADSGFEDRARASKLTRAELRTLQYLPTHLSFRQIGEQNHVSQNTVKTQVRSIYRKLGVGSRAEAVNAAEEAGLIRSGPAGR